MDVRPSRKLMDRSRTEGENLSTLRWWTVAADRCASFKEIDGQVENRRRKCFYFAMMVSCCWWIVRPSSTFRDRLRTAGAIDSTLALMISFHNRMDIANMPFKHISGTCRATAGSNNSTLRLHEIKPYSGVCSCPWNLALFHRACFHTSIVVLCEKLIKAHKDLHTV